MAESKHFTDAKIGKADDEEITFTLRGVPVFVANSLRRSMMDEIRTFTIDPKTIMFPTNTSAWNSDRLTQQLTGVPFYQDTLSKQDINMLEFLLDVSNDGKTYRYVFASELRVRNKETLAEIPNDQFVRQPDTPIFPIGPGQRVEMVSSLEFKTKVEVSRSDMAARHQAATVGYSYDEKNPEEKIVFKAGIFAGYTPSQHISLALDALINRLNAINDAITQNKHEKYVLQLNQNSRYDFILLGETHTIGNLIASWINRYESKCVAGYHPTRDRGAITIDYGLFKFIPPLLQQTERAQDLEKLVQTSMKVLDQQKEKDQRDATVRTFMEHVSRLEKYLSDLKKDLQKLKFVKV